MLEADRLRRRGARGLRRALWHVDGWTHGRVIGRTHTRLRDERAKSEDEVE